MSSVVFSSWFPSSNSFPCVEAVYFVSFLLEATIRSRTVHTVVREKDQFTHLCILHISRRYAWLCFQKDRLHSADAITIPVGSFRRDPWMTLYEAYFVWLPTMYFHCAGCAHLCPGLRSLGCGLLWDDCSPRLLGSRKPFTCRSSRVFPAIFGCLWWVRVCLYHFALPEKAGFGLAADAAEKPLSFDVSSFVPISRWSSSCPRQCIATIFSRTLYWRREQALFLAPLYALVVIRQNFAQFKKVQTRHRCVWITIYDGITFQLNSKRLGAINNSSPPPFIHQGPTNAMHVFMHRATCVKHMNSLLA